jgi:hypothetical protein
MENRRLYLVVILMCGMFTTGLLAGCGPVILSGADAAEVTAFAEPLAENLLAGYAQGNYDVFARDFDTQMRTGLTAAALAEMRTAFDAALGAYQARQLDHIEMADPYFTAVYTLKFEKAPAVAMRLVMTLSEPHKITGLWFDSPELRK